MCVCVCVQALQLFGVSRQVKCDVLGSLLDEGEEKELDTAQKSEKDGLRTKQTEAGTHARAAAGDNGGDKGGVVGGAEGVDTEGVNDQPVAQLMTEYSPFHAYTMEQVGLHTHMHTHTHSTHSNRQLRPQTATHTVA